MDKQAKHTLRSRTSVPQLLSHAAPISLPSRSSSAWWNVPGPLQPQRHRTWECFRPGYDPLTVNLALLQQRQRQDQEQEHLAASMADGANNQLAVDGQAVQPAARGAVDLDTA